MSRIAATPPHRQRGWVGLIALLLAVVIVALLAKTALKQYGLLDAGEARSAAHASSSGAVVSSPGAADVSGAAIESAPQGPVAPLEQARNMGATLQRQADDVAKRMNAAEH